MTDTSLLKLMCSCMQVIELPPGVEPLVLWEPPEASAEEPILVDTMLTRWLRAHQREGVQFLFDCVTGLRSDIGQGEQILNSRLMLILVYRKSQ